MREGLGGLVQLEEDGAERLAAFGDLGGESNDFGKANPSFFQIAGLAGGIAGAKGGVRFLHGGGRGGFWCLGDCQNRENKKDKGRQSWCGLWWFPTLSTERSRQDGARSSCAVRSARPGFLASHRVPAGLGSL